MSDKKSLKQKPTYTHLLDRIFQHQHLCKKKKNIGFTGHLEQRVGTGAKAFVNCKQFLNWHTKHSQSQMIVSPTRIHYPDTECVCGHPMQSIYSHWGQEQCQGMACVWPWGRWRCIGLKALHHDPFHSWWHAHIRAAKFDPSSRSASLLIPSLHGRD